MEGRSLLPLMKGNDVESRPVFSMQLMENRAIGNDPITKGTIAAWEGDFKLIHYLEDKKSLLFNIRKDPDESLDIYIEKPELTHRLTKLIEDEIAAANKRITQRSVSKQ
jgi:hypothetical protein